MNTQFFDEREYRNLAAWQTEFERWRNELENTERSFSPLSNDSTNFRGLVKERVVNMEDISYLYLQMLNASKDDKKNDRSLLGAMLSYAYTAIDSYTAKINKS